MTRRWNPPSWWVRWTLALRESSRRSALTKTESRLKKEQARMVLLLRAVDQSNLRLKELEHRSYLLLLQEKELEESRQYRENPALLAGPTQDDLRDLLGL